MIRLVLSNRKTKNIVALLLTAIMIFQLFSSVDWVMVAEAATPDTYTIEGIIRYSGDDDWKDAIRPLTFDYSKIKLFMQIKFDDGDVLSATRDLQSTNADGNYHLQFIHDGNGGGKFTISNIPKTFSFGRGIAHVNYCQVQVNGVNFYNNVSSSKITFDKTTGAASGDSEMILQPITVALNIKTGVIGEENTSTSFDVNVKVTNSSENRIAQKTVRVSNSDESGSTVNVPIGLDCLVSQKNKDNYTLVSYNLSYKHSGGKVSLQQNVKPLKSFKLNSVQASNTVKQYNVFIQNAAQNKKVEWKVKWIDNYNEKRPKPSFKLQYSIDDKTYQDITSSNIAKLGLISVPKYIEVKEGIVKDDNIKSYYYENLPNTTIDGKEIYYKVVQTTNNTAYMYEYDSENSIFYNTLKGKFSATLLWLDNGDKVDTIRPTINQVKENLKLYSCVGNKYSEVALNSDEKNIISSKNRWELEIKKDLPQYDKNNNKITYVLIEGELDNTGKVTKKIKTIKKNGYTGADEYKVSYYNKGATETVSDRCYDGQLIIHTSDSKYVFKSTKVWKDDSNVKRPKTRVTLWRYAKKNSNDFTIDIAKSARVIAKDNSGEDIILSYILKTSDKTAQEAGNVNVEEIKFDKSTIKNLADNYCIPKYDEEGNEYIYFIMESMDELTDKEGSYYESAFSVRDSRIQVENTSKDEKSRVTGFIDNGGTITSTRKGKISVKINKIWNAASAMSDLEGAKVEFKILGKSHLSNTYSEITPLNDEKAEITDFGVLKTRGTVEVLINPYDSNGKKYEDKKVIEAGINTEKDGNVKLDYDSNDNCSLKFSIKGHDKVINQYGEETNEDKEIKNDYEGKCSSLEEVGSSIKYENVKSYVCNVENTIITEKKYTFVTIWDGVTPVKQTSYLTGISSVDKKEFKYKIVMDTNGKGCLYKLAKDGKESLYKTFNYTNETGDWIVKEIPGLPQYTDEGYAISYTIHDANNSNGGGDYWIIAYNNTDQGTVLTNMRRRDVPGHLVTAGKLWNDDGDVLNRYNVKIKISTPAYKWVPVVTPEPTPTPKPTATPTANIDTSQAPITVEPTEASEVTGTLEPTETSEPEPTPEMTLVPDGTNDVAVELNALKFWKNKMVIESSSHMKYKESTIREVLVGDNGKEYTSEPDKEYTSEPTVEPIMENGVETGEQYTKKEKHTLTTDRFQYDVLITRKVLIPKDGKLDVMSVKVENTRKEFVDIVIKQQWQDSGNIKGIRPSKAVFTLYTIGDKFKEIKLDTSLENTENSNFKVEDKNGICTWTYTIKRQPKFDENGLLYKYTIKELPKLYKADGTEIKYSTDGGDYTGTINYKYTKYNGKENLKHNDSIEYTCLCKLKSKIDFVVYQQWKDEAIGNNTRPDIYLSLYRYVNNTAGPAAPTPIDEYANQVWEETGKDNDYNWKITFKNLDKYDAYGNEYVYYVTEKLNNADKESSESNTGFKYITSYENKDPYSTTTDKVYANGKIVNLLNDTIEIKGEKIWKNIAGFELKDLPVPIVSLYREEAGTSDNEQLINTIELKDGATQYTFDKDKDNNPLQKYDNRGRAYTYYLQENQKNISTAGKCEEGDLYKVSYVNNSIVNEFNIDSNRRSIVVTKKWDMSDVPDEEKSQVQYPEVKINLYRYIGVLHDKTTEDEPTDISEMEFVETRVIKPEDIQGNDKIVKFEDLLIYSPRGDRYHYYVQEEKINGYSVSYIGDPNTKVNSTQGIYIKDVKKIIGTTGAEKNNITKVEITNKYDPAAENTVKGIKAWKDYKNFYKLRPESISIELYRYTNSEPGYNNGIARYRVSFEEENATGLDKNKKRYISWGSVQSNNVEWYYEIHNLAQYAPNGQPYIYVVKEVLAKDSDYCVNHSEVSSGTYNNKVVNMTTITNSLNGTCEVKKHWIDGDNKYKFRPKSVTMKLQRRVKGENAKWADVANPEDLSNVVTKVLNKDNVVANTKDNTWRYVFDNLPSKIMVDTDGDNKPDKKKEVEYQCVETHIGKTPFREGSNEIGAYVMSVNSNDNNVTEIVNSMRTTDITINVNWDDVKNYYQTRFGKVYVKLEATDQVEGKHPDASTKWTQVTDIDGKPIVLEINSSNATTDANGNTVWKKKFDSLPLERIGKSDEETSVALHYRAVLCTVQDSYYKHPQNVSVINSGSGYKIYARKTYHNYDDVSKYDTTAWSCSADSKANYMDLDLRMITNEIANEDDSKNRVYLVEAEKKWCKDDTASYYAVDIELRKSNNGGVSYTSYPSKLTKRIKKDGPAVSWMEMPAYDENGKDLTYKLYEITTNAWYKCHTDIVTSDAKPGKMDKYTFTNVQQLDYTMKKIWSKNDRVLPTNIGQFRAKFKLQQKIGDDGTWKDSLDDKGVLREREMYVNNRNNASTSSMIYQKIPKYTLDNKRIYYRAVETKVNNVDQATNIAYTMLNADLEEGGTAYTDNNYTEVTNTLRTVSLNITMNWDDDNNHDNVRPTTAQTKKFNIDVYADYGRGFVKLSPSFYNLKWDTSTANVWKATLINMPKYTYDGKTMIKYKVVQSAVPPRYFITETPDIPTFDDATDEYDYSLSNTLNLLVKLKKYDAVNNKGLQGTKFILYKREFNRQGYVDNAVENMTADKNGNISFEVQKLGLYRLVETKAVRGYVDKLDIYGEPDYEDGYSFECAFNVDNENLRQTVNINNTNSVEGRGIYESQSVLNKANRFTTASEPTLTPAAAVVPEIGVESGWGSLITANGLVNKRKLGELSFSKQDDVTKTMLDGVKFELYKYANEDGTGAKKYVGDIITGNDYVCSTSGTLTVSSTGKNREKGNVHISKLPWGKYTLKEVKALPGYALPTSEYSFVVNASTVNDTTHLNENIYIQYNGKVMTNNVLPNIKTRFDFKKLGLNNKQLKGGSFKIVSNDKDSITQSFWNVITDDISLRVNDLKPNVTVYGLPVGSYRIIETDAPYGYKYTSDVVFSIDQCGNVKNSTGTILGDKVVKMVDESIDIKIINVDEDFVKPINGSTFELTGKFATNDGSEVTDVETRSCKITSLEWFIRENILPTVKDTPSNIYKLKQTNVPAAYEYQPQEVYFKIDENYNIVLTDENGNTPSAELQEAYDIFIKVDNSDVPSIIFENLRIPKNDIYIENGEDYVDELGNIICKIFYAYDTNRYDVRLGEPIRFYIDKTNLGLLDFAVTTSKNVKDTSSYVDSKYIKIYGPDGEGVQAVNNKYNLKENVYYTMYIDSELIKDCETGSKMLYLYSHMPRKDDTEAVYIVRRTAFPRN